MRKLTEIKPPRFAWEDVRALLRLRDVERVWITYLGKHLPVGVPVTGGYRKKVRMRLDVEVRRIVFVAEGERPVIAYQPINVFMTFDSFTVRRSIGRRLRGKMRLVIETDGVRIEAEVEAYDTTLGFGDDAAPGDWAGKGKPFLKQIVPVTMKARLLEAPKITEVKKRCAGSSASRRQKTSK